MSPPQLYLLLCNVGKKQNFGTLIRSACAFGVSAILVVGAKKLATFGSQGTALHANFVYLESIEEAISWLAANGAKLVGIEITPEAVPVDRLACEGQSMCFMLGNEAVGMNEKQIKGRSKENRDLAF